MEEKPTHSIVYVTHGENKRMFHTVTAKNSSEAAIKAKIWFAENKIQVDIKLIMEHGDMHEGKNAVITFNADLLNLDEEAGEVKNDAE